MSSRAKRFSACAVFAVVLLAPAGVLTAPAAAAVSYEDAVPGLAPPGTPGIGALHGSYEENGLSQEALVCTPETFADNPHPSSTPGVISGHGWWGQGDCSSNRANVQNCLYEYYTDNSWRLKACSDTRELRQYTGSGDRTVARHDCHSTARTSWRNHVDVDVIGEIDSGEKPYNQANVDCRVN